jgi:hypothetical protein
MIIFSLDFRAIHISLEPRRIRRIPAEANVIFAIPQLKGGIIDLYEL